MSDVESEARHLLACFANAPDPLGRSMERVSWQFGIMQSRSQLLLTLATITLTITGFSGPKIAESSPAARWGLGLGLSLVLASVLLLLANLRIRWLSQFLTGDDLRDLTAMIHHRDEKTRWYRIQICLLGTGLIAYVGAIVIYLLHGVPA